MERYNRYLVDFDKNKALHPNNVAFFIEKIQERFKLNLPIDYIEFMADYNGGEGSIGESYIVLYPLEDIIEINEDNEIEEFDSQILIIGSNGAGEAFALDYRSDEVKYIMIPFLFEHEAIIKQSNTLDGFLLRAYEDKLFD